MSQHIPIIKHPEKLRAVMQEIREENFDMQYWVKRKSELSSGYSGYSYPSPWPNECKNLDSRDCGTIACLAGWTCHVFAREVDQNLTIEQNARRILGISDIESDTLFIRTMWPHKYFNDEVACETPGEQLTQLRKYAEEICTESEKQEGV